MTALPDSLRPWREWLSWFDPDLATQLGPLLQRLHPLLGPFRGHSTGGDPEIEGLDDLRVRGSYEHLLATEWLLADEMPDEFLRRAASGEHIFLAPRPRARRSDRSIVALFDAGPLQFGAPRLAHIAIWILLARRAQQAQGEFRWGTLQAPGELREARTVENLKALLQQRTFMAPDEVGLAGWRRALESPRKGGELWMIGPARNPAEFLAAPTFTHRVSLQRDLPGTALEVSLFERGTERGVRLPLPEAGAVTPLLRGIFVREASPALHISDPNPVSLMRPPVFSLDGARVGLALRDEPATLLFGVPRMQQVRPAKPRRQRWSAGYSALGMSFIGKQMGVLLADEEVLRLWGSSLGTLRRPPQEDFHAPGSTAAWLPLAWLRTGQWQRACIIDQSRRLMRWDSGALQVKLQLTAEHVLSMAQINKDLVVYAYWLNGSVRTAKLGVKGDPQPPKFICGAPQNATVLFGRGRACAVLVEETPQETWHIGTWSVFETQTRLQLPGGSRAIGVMREPNGRNGLITLDRDTLRLQFGDGNNELLYTAPHRIVTCSVCPNSGHVAMLTERREFIVVSAATRDLRLIVQTGRQPDAPQ